MQTYMKQIKTLGVNFSHFKDDKTIVYFHYFVFKHVRIINEPPHGKTNNLNRRKQRRRSASQ